MTDIPEDVMKTTGDVFGEILSCVSSDPIVMAMPIARAILAERERCAKVIEGKSHDGIRGSWWHEKFARMADEIRKGTEQ